MSLSTSRNEKSDSKISISFKLFAIEKKVKNRIIGDVKHLNIKTL
jgi:hypothetical protein